MTDNEIVKALECCVNKGYPQGCDDCPYRGLDCNERLDADALDLINRQKAEIEMNDAEIKELRIALQGYLDDVTKARNLYKQSIEELNQANAEIERLEAERMMADGYADALEEQAKTKAYREFAERLKELIKKYSVGNGLTQLRNSHVDNLLKELVGEDDE